MILIAFDKSFKDWRLKARELLAQRIPPENVHWHTDSSEFIFGEEFIQKNTPAQITISKDFFELAQLVSCHRDEHIWGLLYKVAWRLVYENKNLLQIPLDPDIKALNSLARSVSRDCHKMHAFVRFREVPQEDGDSIFMAWYRPDHRITRLVANFFKDRFNGMKWIIMTSDETIMWDKKSLFYGEGVENFEIPDDDKENLWKTYYSSIFNPARIKVNAMKKEFPVRYWNTLPETELITSLLNEAPQRVQEFYQSQSPINPIENHSSLLALNESLLSCTKCDSCSGQTPLLGHGHLSPKIVLVFEKKSSYEEIFIKKLVEAGFSVDEIYTTYSSRGSQVSSKSIAACRTWLYNEIKLLRPKYLISVGRLSAQSIMGKLVRVEDYHYELFPSPLCLETLLLKENQSLAFKIADKTVVSP